MSSKPNSKSSAPMRFLFENSIFLIVGAVGALVWANVDHLTDTHTYHRFVHFELRRLFSEDGLASHDVLAPSPEEDGELEGEAAGGEEGGRKRKDGAEEEHDAITLHFIVNDLLMALFFAIAGKEVWEALLPGGPLSKPRKAASPLFATLGGIVGPALIYAGGAYFLGSWPELGAGWAVPCATDIAFSYLAARLIFGASHPAIAFLLLLAIADDAAGLVILAVFYPKGELNLWWMLLSAAAVVLGFGFRRLRLHSFWWYLAIPGTLSWFAFYMAGIHPALGLVPIIPCMPHAHTDLGIFAREELGRHDTLNEFEHWFKNPVEIVLGLFGLVNAGVVLSSVGPGTWLVLGGLVVGKPVGITALTWLGEKLFRFQIPAGMNYRHVISLGCVAGIGFTVALFVAEAASTKLGGPTVVDSVKMGALASFGAALVAFIVARALGVRPLGAGAAVEEEEPEPAHMNAKAGQLA